MIYIILMKKKTWWSLFSHICLADSNVEHHFLNIYSFLLTDFPPAVVALASKLSCSKMAILITWKYFPITALDVVYADAGVNTVCISC